MQKAFSNSTINDTFVNKSRLKHPSKGVHYKSHSNPITADQYKISSEELMRDTGNELRAITSFSNHYLFSSEASALELICKYFYSNSAKKKVLYIGFPMHLAPDHCHCFPQLRGAKSYLTSSIPDISALIVDPLFMIQNAVDFAQRIYVLRELCKKNNIPFLLDERKTIARLHRKAIDEIYQFHADGLLLGENISGAYHLGVFAFNDTLLHRNMGTIKQRVPMEAMLACRQHAKEITQQPNAFYIHWNALGHSLCAAVNKRLRREYPRGIVRNCGSIVWTLNFGCRRAQKTLRAEQLLQGTENCIYLPTQSSENIRIENKIVALLRKKKPAAKLQQVKKTND